MALILSFNLPPAGLPGDHHVPLESQHGQRHNGLNSCTGLEAVAGAETN